MKKSTRTGVGVRCSALLAVFLLFAPRRALEKGFVATSAASIKSRTGVWLRQKAFIPIYKTLSAEPMRGLTGLALRLVGINVNLRPGFKKFIVCCLGVPVLVFRELLLKFVFNLGQLIILFPDIQNSSLQREELIREIDVYLLDFDIRGEVIVAFRSFDYCFDR